MNFSQKLSEIPEKRIWTYSALITIFVAWFSEGFHHFDEHFQIIEFMNFKLGGTQIDALPWEYHKKLRPWFQSYLYLAIDSPLRWVEASPFLRTFWLRLISAFFALFCQYIFYRRVIKSSFENELSKKILIISQFIWFIPYINVRPSSEALSISFFLLGTALILKERNLGVIFGGAFILGLSYLTRFQMGLPISVFWFWGVYYEWNPKKYLVFALAITLIFFIGYGIDTLGYGEPSFPLWNYFKYNFLEGVLDQMGVSPWHKYLTWSLIKPIPPISLILFWGTLVFWKNHLKDKHSWITYVTASFFIFHTFIGHKELRFIFLIAYLAPLMSFISLKRMPPNWLWIINFILILFTLKPANRMIPLYKFLYKSNIQEVHYVEEDPTKLVGLPLQFYMKKDFKTLPLGESTPEEKYIFTKRFPSTEKFLNNSKCEAMFLTYPKFILDYTFIKKKLKRSKFMGIFKC